MTDELETKPRESMCNCDPPNNQAELRKDDQPLIGAIDDDGNVIAKGTSHEEVARKVSELAAKSGRKRIPFSFFTPNR